MAQTSKRMRASREGLDRNKFYTLSDALKEILERASAKFDETVEISMNLGVDPRHADQNLRGALILPSGTGKTVRVAVFARDTRAIEAKEAGADAVGAEDLMAEFQAGKSDVDRVIATPDMMPIVGRLGRILGPRGLMPNHKLGTVTNDVAAAVKAAKGGQVEFRVDKTGIVHCGLGKISFGAEGLMKNLTSFIDTIMKNKPSGAKGTYVKSVSLCSTMGPGVKVDVATIVKAR